MPTALELGPDGWAPYIKRSREKSPAADDGADRQLPARLVAQARKAARKLKTDYGATRVVLFGSLAHRAWFHSDSDIDLAVEGMAPGVLWSAWRFVERYFPGQRVDLVEYETAGGSLRRAIDAEGIEL